MICPKCGFEQEEAVECLKCGVIIEKSRALLNSPAPPDDPSTGTSKRSFGVLGDLEMRVSRIIDAFVETIGIHPAIALLIFRKRSVRWFRDVVDRLVTVCVYFCFAGLGFLFFLNVSKVLWALYLELPLGKQFLNYYPARAAVIYRILGFTSLNFAVNLCWIAVMVCICVGATARLLFIAGWFYSYRGMFLRFLVWPALCAIPGAWIVTENYNLGRQSAFMLILLPCIILCHPCFRVMFRCLPELDVLAVIRRMPVWFTKTREIVKRINVADE